MRLATRYLLLLPILIGFPPLAQGGGSPEETTSPCEERITAWKRWKDISKAIEIAPLDGPEEITEKIEIIEDRIDDLDGEKRLLSTDLERLAASSHTLALKITGLQRLLDMRRRTDLLLQRRLQSLKSRRASLVPKIECLETNLEEISAEVERLRGLSRKYSGIRKRRNEEERRM